MEPSSVSPSERRRTYAREYARRKRERALSTERRATKKCPRRAGPGQCGGELDVVIDLLGRAIISCALCERRERGTCRDCSAPVEGTVRKAMRCARHKEEARSRQIRASGLRHREEQRARNRERYHQPAVRARRIEYKRLWRKANPEKVRAGKYRALVRHGKARDKYLRWHKRYNSRKTRQLTKRAEATLAYYATHPNRPVPQCRGCKLYLDWIPLPNGRAGCPPRWCDGCASPAELARRKKSGRSIVALETPPPPRHIALRMVERLQKQFADRTCLTPGCDVVLKGRAKKCPECKARELELARRLLMARQGRGRRVDLEGAA